MKKLLLTLLMAFSIGYVFAETLEVTSTTLSQYPNTVNTANNPSTFSMFLDENKEFTFTGERGTSTQYTPRYNSNVIQIYAGNKITISYSKGIIKKIVFKMSTDFGSATSSTGAYSKDTKTWAPLENEAPVSSVSINNTGSAQAKLSSITIEYEPQSLDFSWTAPEALNGETGDTFTKDELIEKLGLPTNRPEITFAAEGACSWANDVLTLSNEAGEGKLLLSWDADDTFTAGSAEVKVVVTAKDMREEVIIDMNETKTANMWDGETFELEYAVEPDVELTFTSSNTDVATIDETGLVTLKKAGTTTLTASFAGNDAYLPAEEAMVLTVKDIDYITVTPSSNSFIRLGQLITISCPTEGVTLEYAINDKDGDRIAYSEPFAITEEMAIEDNVQVFAFATIGTRTRTYSVNYTIKEPTFDFDVENAYGLTTGTYYKTETTITGLKDVVAKITYDGTADGYRHFAITGANSGHYDFRMYANTTMTIIAPEGKYIESVVFKNLTGTNAPTINKFAKSVSFSGKYNITEIYVTLVEPMKNIAYDENEVAKEFGEEVVEFKGVSDTHCVKIHVAEGYKLFYCNHAAPAAEMVAAAEDHTHDWTEAEEATVSLTGTGTVYLAAGKSADSLTEPVALNYSVVKNTETGIETIEAEAGAAEYYNLQGVRVAVPTTGLYIRVQNGRSTKVVVR